MVGCQLAFSEERRPLLCIPRELVRAFHGKPGSCQLGGWRRNGCRRNAGVDVDTFEQAHGNEEEIM